MAFLSSNRISSSTIMAIHETQDRTLLTVILRFTTFFFFNLVNYLGKKTLTVQALWPTSACVQLYIFHMQKKKKKASIFGTHLCTWAVIALHLKILGLKTGMSCKEMSRPLKPE